MDTGGDLADTSLHTSLITQIGDVLAAFTDDYAGVFGADKCAKGEGVLTRRGRGTRGVWGTWKADDKVSDHRWDDQEDDKPTGFAGNLVVLGVGGHEERRRRGGRKEGRREKGDGEREEGDARKLGWQTDNKTRHRGVHQPDASSHAFFGSPPLNFSLSDPPVRVRQRVQKS